MAAVALDTNVLVYAFLDPQTNKGTRAAEIVRRAGAGGLIAAQVLSELLSVTRRKDPALLSEAAGWLRQLATSYAVVNTDLEVLLKAAGIAQRYRIQMFDSVICAASIKGGGTVLLSEEMQDGQRITGLRILNPFAPGNQAEVEALLA